LAKTAETIEISGRKVPSLLASSRLADTQVSILAKLKRLGPMTINALAEELVMDAWPEDRSARQQCRGGRPGRFRLTAVIYMTSDI
jgi:hypothetical protein